MCPNKQPHLWLRVESKPLEHRSALTPTTAKCLVDEGFQVTVEKSTQRCFRDEEFSSIGCAMVEEGSWHQAPADAYILGLKELPENENFPLHHTHIYFAHCFKYQTGWQLVLDRFRQGNATLLDLEFLQDEQGKRVASFGHIAGIVGCAIAIDVWCYKNLKENEVDYPALKPFTSQQELVDSVKSNLKAAVEKRDGDYPKIMVMGALGKCGGGASSFAEKVGIPVENVEKWDRQETQKAGNGPYEIMLDVVCSPGSALSNAVSVDSMLLKKAGEKDILINCVYLDSQDTSSPVFVTHRMLKDAPRSVLSVICDVSCDVGSANHPLPLYNNNTTFDKPTLRLETSSGQSVHVVSIDHLPSLLPKESSEQFSTELLPTLLELKKRNKSRVWMDAEQIFREKLAELS